VPVRRRHQPDIFAGTPAEFANESGRRFVDEVDEVDAVSLVRWFSIWRLHASACWNDALNRRSS
jgi:hypothetical protein